MLALHSPDLGDGTMPNVEQYISDPRWVDVAYGDGEVFSPPQLPDCAGYPAAAPGLPVVPPLRGHEGGRGDVVVSGYGSERVDTGFGPMITYAYEARSEDNVMLRAPVRRLQCANGLIYEDAPYHGINGNSVKSKRPIDPCYALENSFVVKETSAQRIGYDETNQEFVVFMEQRSGEFHGHVRSWEDLDQEQKNVLIRQFGMNAKGKGPRNRG